MAMIDALLTLCKKLVSHGWGPLLHHYGLDIDQTSAAALEEALLARLPRVRRQLPGFEDFAADGRRGIEPGCPCSLLYHALASPNVVTELGDHPLRYFPTWADLELVENYVFGVRPPSLRDLAKMAGKQPLAIVVFAQEYRPAAETCHRRHADTVYSRTGVARVGTAEAVYEGRLRGFLPDVADNPRSMAVLPSRFAAYLAVRQRGKKSESRPMRFRTVKDAHSPTVRKPDNERRFWIPVHKLFSGDECLQGLDLHVDFSCRHFNEKIRRVHIQLNKKDIRVAPYLFCNGIAELAPHHVHGAGVLVPVVHPRLVEPAQIKDGPNQGDWVTFRVHKERVSPAYSSVALFEGELSNGVLWRDAPQYVNGKIEVLDDGSLVDINQDPRYETLRKRADAGDYNALHFVDFTGDGWVQAHCPELQGLPDFLGEAHAAYSLVTAPDFFPRCDQRELTEWTDSLKLPRKMKGRHSKGKAIWKETPPDTLSDQRYPANLQLPLDESEPYPFDRDEDTITALVSLHNSPGVPPGHAFTKNDVPRHAHLPDDAAGIFDPGWDVSLDRLVVKRRHIYHLAAYGLGSPFPEDAKLCAALSEFWPAVSPDTTRVMEPLADPAVHTTCPLTDAEIGQQGDLPWDGVNGPRTVLIEDVPYAAFVDFHHVDYVQNALAGQFSLRLTGHVDSTEYENRVLAMAAVHSSIQRAAKRWSDWIVLSFRVVRFDPESKGPQPTILPADVDEFESARQAVDKTGTIHWSSPVYRFEMFTRRVSKTKHNVSHVDPDDFRKRLLPIRDRRLYFVDPVSRNLCRRSDGRDWKHETF